MAQLLSVQDVLLQCQVGMQCHTKLIKVLKKIYYTMGLENFWSEFVELIKFPMVVYNREPAVERTIDFIAKFATSLSSPPHKEKDGQTPESDCDDANPLLQRLFDFLMQHHDARDKGVRFRVCQLVTKLLSNLGDEATINDELYMRVYQCMLERLKDKSAVVRVHAVLALVRLQDPADDSCSVIKAYIFLMTSDPNAEVRKTIVSHIAPCRKTLEAILERTRDVKDSVRRAAFSLIAEKIPLKALSISQRVQLLMQGLNDRAESVKGVCGGRLLQSWLMACQGDVLDLLQCLDVENSTDICRQMLTRLFTDAAISDLIANFNLLNDRCVVSRDKLTCESAMYWQELCSHVHNAGTDYEEHLDMILPSCLNFCEYLKSVVGEFEECQDLDRQLDLEFIVQQLLRLFSSMDLADQVCRKAVEKFLHRLLLSEYMGYSLVPHLLPCLQQLHPVTEPLINYLAETVAEIRQPITTVEKAVNAEEQRKIDLQVAKVRVQLNQVREEMEESVRNQEFQRAAELKESIRSLEQERSSLLSCAEPTIEEIKTEKLSSRSLEQERLLLLSLIESTIKNVKEDERSRLKRCRERSIEKDEGSRRDSLGAEKNDAATLMKCLTIICEMLETLPLKILTPTMQMLMESQILPGMCNQEASVRNLAVKAIGLCCQLKRDIIMFHLPVLMQASQVDVECVRVTAIKSLFDLIHIYGLGVFEDAAQAEGSENSNDTSVDMFEENTSANENSTSESKDEGHSKPGWSKTASNLIAILSSTLDTETGELCTTVSEGLAKLLMSGRVFSAGLLSRLLLLWYNPLFEEDARLRHILGTFFPIFAFTDSGNQQLFEECFLPTLRTILNAPTTSPLNSVNASNVADFLVELTHAQQLVSSQTSNTPIRENPCHDSIAEKVCNEILSNPQSFQLRLWTRVLNQLGLSPDNVLHLKDLSVLCQQMLEVVKERNSVKALEKFHKTVSTLLAQLVAADCASDGEEETRAAADTMQQAGDISIQAADIHTPNMPPPTGQPLTAKSTAHRTRAKKVDNSQLDCTFTTPSQQKELNRTAGEADVENLRSNLDSLLLDTSKAARTPGSKRALHTIQDPGLL